MYLLPSNYCHTDEDFGEVESGACNLNDSPSSAVASWAEEASVHSCSAGGVPQSCHLVTVPDSDKDCCSYSRDFEALDFHSLMANHLVAKCCFLP